MFDFFIKSIDKEQVFDYTDNKNIRSVTSCEGLIRKRCGR